MTNWFHLFFSFLNQWILILIFNTLNKCAPLPPWVILKQIPEIIFYPEVDICISEIQIYFTYNHTTIITPKKLTVNNLSSKKQSSVQCVKFFLCFGPPLLCWSPWWLKAKLRNVLSWCPQRNCHTIMVQKCHPSNLSAGTPWDSMTSWSIMLWPNWCWFKTVRMVVWQINLKHIQTGDC